MDYHVLKSGSDLRGAAVGENAVLTADTARLFGYVFAGYLADTLGKKISNVRVALGRDSRVSGPELLRAAAEGVLAAGAEAVDCGLCTTPAMYMAILTEDFAPDGSIMLTASHHPWIMNGMKFFTPKGGIGFEELDKLIETAENTALPAASGRAVEKRAFLEEYARQLEELIRGKIAPESEQPLKGLRVAVDAGNGAGGFYAAMLERLGADVTGSRFLEPDGHFPNHIPNPENEEAMASVCSAVKEVGADLGVIFDADCDRAAIVDGDGREINRNRLIALISAILLEEKPGGTIVTDSVTSTGLSEFIRCRGGVHYRFKRGYRNVIDEALRLNGEGIDCPLAIETSGHAALRSNHFLDDGMYLATLLLIRSYQMKARGEKLSSLLADLKEPVESREVRLSILNDDFRETGKRAIEYVQAEAERREGWHIADDNREGVRVFFDVDGKPRSAWFLLRLSVHDPVMPVNAESDVPGGARLVMKKLYGLLADWKDLKAEVLKETTEAL